MTANVPLTQVFPMDLFLIDSKGLEKRFSNKGVHVDCTKIAGQYKELLDLMQKRDQVRKDLNTASKNNHGPNFTCRQLSQQAKDLDKQVSELADKIRDEVIGLPNPPAEGVPPGGKENNQVIKTWGRKTPRPRYDHIEVCQKFDLVDYERGRKLAGEGFPLYMGQGAMLEWALLQFFWDKHTRAGYTPLWLPIMLNERCGFVTGQFPKFQQEVYRVDDGHFLLPTAETGIIPLHAEELLLEEDLPKRYFAYTPCFRVEAGSSRKAERGTIRTHQFNKVELIQLTHPDHSMESLTEMLGYVESLMQDLGLHYRVTQLAAQDCSYSMAITYDMEVWIPSMGIYKEVSSVSNAYDFQARRGNIRFKDPDCHKRYVHTLNGSGLATSRVFPAILEQYQLPDGSGVIVPEVLRQYLPFSVIR